MYRDLWALKEEMMSRSFFENGLSNSGKEVCGGGNQTYEQENRVRTKEMNERTRELREKR